MVQISAVSGSRLSTVESSVAGATRLAQAVKGTSAGGDFSDSDGTEVERDRQQLAVSGKFAAEGKARSAANANAAEGSSMLQVADDALASIRVKLDRLAAIALEAEQPDLTTQDRARMDVEFQTVKDEIDAIAANTAFNGIKLLQGGSGSGGEFEVSFKVGTGAETSDDITVSIAPASVSDLSAGLEAGGVTSMVGASTARTTVAAAVDVLDTIRGGLAGDMERFSIAARSNMVIAREVGETQASLTTPAVVIDLAQMVARRAAEDGGYDLEDRTVDQLRQLLIKLGDQDFTAGALSRADNAAATGGGGSGDSAPAPKTGSGGSSDSSTKDAA